MISYKYRIYPNKQQEEQLKKTIGCSRLVYNLMLEDRQKLYEKFKNDNISKDEFDELNRKITPASYKKEYEFLKEVDSLSLAWSWTNLNSAFSNFFKGLKTSKNIGYPKFKSKKKSKHSFTTSNVNNNIVVENSYIKLPKTTPIKIVLHRPYIGNIKNVTIEHNRANQWFVSIVTDDKNTYHKEKTNKSIGLDLGLTHFLTDSNGNKIENPRVGKKLSKKLSDNQRKLSKRQNVALKQKRKLEDSKNYQKQKIKVARIHQKIKNKRKDFLHKLSTNIVNENDLIAIEDLAVKNMIKNHNLANAISDVSWSMFVEMLSYKCERYEKQLVKIDRFFASSQICNVCSTNNGKKELHVREWTCTNCSSVLDRDINAALNILNRGRDDLDSSVNILTLVDNSQEKRVRRNSCEAITS